MYEGISLNCIGSMPDFRITLHIENIEQKIYLNYEQMPLLVFLIVAQDNYFNRFFWSVRI